MVFRAYRTLEREQVVVKVFGGNANHYRLIFKRILLSLWVSNYLFDLTFVYGIYELIINTMCIGYTTATA